MVNGFRVYNPEHNGALEVEGTDRKCVEVFFIPPRHSLIEANLDPNMAREYRTKLIEIDEYHKYIKIFPINTFGDKPDFLKPKYEKIERIRIDGRYSAFAASDDVCDELEYLPPTFIKNYAYGLGLAKPYRFIIEAIEELTDCKELAISNTYPTGPDKNGNPVFYIEKKDYELIRKELNKVDQHARIAARSVKDVTVYNILARQLNLPQLDPKVGRHPYRRQFTAAVQGRRELSLEDQNEVISVLRNHAASFVDDQPEKLVKLRGDIELVSLKAFITIFRDRITKSLKESVWQKFFSDNPFVLNMAFGYPLIKVLGQASVGGAKLKGDGQKIVDFLLKNSLTNNTAIVEIKTPQTKILSARPYRQGVFAPSTHLTNSISQVLDQKYQFQRSFILTKDTSRMHDIESYAVHCCLIIGSMPNEEDQKKSFELYRHNSKDVEIVTFDELLDNLIQLHTYLSGAGSST